MIFDRRCIKLHFVVLAAIFLLFDGGQHAMAGPPVVIAHRGYSAKAPENTLAAIRVAIEAEIKFIEIDVQLSSDGVPVLIHDKTVDRTTNGTGKVADLTLPQLKGLDAGSWFDEKFTGEPIPTLAEAFRLAKGKATLLLDIKAPGIARAVATVLSEEEIEPTAVQILVWNEAHHQDFRRHLPEAKQYLTGKGLRTYSKQMFDEYRDAGIEGFNLSHKKTDPKFLQAALDAGSRVYVWTINDEETALRFAEKGVHGIVSDNPEAIRAALKKAEAATVQ